MKVIYSWRVSSNQELSQNTKVVRKELTKFAKRACELAKLPTTLDWIFSINFLDDKKMAKANMEYLTHVGTTDVITFSYLDDLESLFSEDIGLELLICSDFAEREGSNRKNSSYKRELALYIVHGVLHAANYDDLEPQSRALMRRAERRLMKKLLSEFDIDSLFVSKS